MSGMFRRFVFGEVSEQAFFDACAKAVLQQGAPSVSEGGTCLYDGGNGLRCAIGWQLDGAELRTAHTRERVPDEGLGVRELAKELYGPAIQNDNAAVRFAVEIQGAHDSASVGIGEFIPEFKRQMRLLAANHHLDAASVA